MKHLKIAVFALLCACGCAIFWETPDVLAQVNNGMVRDVDNPQNVSDATSYHGSFREAAITIVNYFLYFVGLISVIMVIYGGFMYITSQGEDTDKAKKIILYASIGIIVILVSFALVNTILGSGDANGTGQD